MTFSPLSFAPSRIESSRSKSNSPSRGSMRLHMNSPTRTMSAPQVLPHLLRRPLLGVVVHADDHLVLLRRRRGAVDRGSLRREGEGDGRRRKADEEQRRRGPEGDGDGADVGRCLRHRFARSSEIPPRPRFILLLFPAIDLALLLPIQKMSLVLRSAIGNRNQYQPYYL